MTTITLVQKVNLNGSTAATSFNMPAITVTAGDSMTLQIRSGGTSQTITVTDNQGNTWQQDIAPTWIASFGSICAFSAHNCAGGSTTVTITYGTTAVSCRAELEEYSFGSGNKGAFDVGTQNNAASGTALDSTSVTPASANAVAIGFGATANTTSSTWTVGSGYGNLDPIPSGTNNIAGFEDQQLSSTASINATLTMSASQAWAMLIAIYKAVAVTAAAVVIGRGAGESPAIAGPF